MKNIILVLTASLVLIMIGCGKSERQKRIDSLLQENENLNTDLENKKRKILYESNGMEYDSTVELKPKIVE